MNSWDGTKFAIVMPWGRVGSNLVVRVLSAEGGVPIANEPTTAIRSRADSKGRGEFDVDLAQEEFLKKFPRASLWPSLRLQNKAGMKLAHGSFISPMNAYQTLRQNGFRLITMDRHNHIKSAVSKIRADQRRNIDRKQAFAVAAGSAKPGPSTIPPKQLVKVAEIFRNRSQAMHSYVEHTFGNDRLDIWYEDLLADPVLVIRQIADFLEIGLPPQITLPYKKATSDNLCEDVRNYDEVAKEVQDAGLGAFLEG